MVEHVDEGAPVEVPVQVLDEEVDQAVVLFHHRARRVGRDDDIRHCPQRAVGGKRLTCEYVEPGASQAPVYYDYQFMIEDRPTPESKIRLAFFGSDDNLKILIDQPTAGEARGTA